MIPTALTIAGSDPSGGAGIQADLKTFSALKVYGMSVTEPYFTPNGVGLTGNVTYRDQTQFVSASSDFSSETLGAGFDVGYPIGEAQGVRIGLQFQKSSLLTTEGSSARQSITWVALNGDSFHQCIDYDVTTPSCDVSIWSTDYRTVELNASWNYDSRNRSLFADRGMRHSLGLAYALPGASDVEYYVASYEFIKYVPLFGRFTLRPTAAGRHR